ncbi:alpha/beta hydrolase [Nakamurella flavida]|uniref:Alpha/beta hydrolase n=1 Tax=Nakamurella flavida TaxID=363630 RepID=A0A938YEG2_9ACTN|nr:alpha/beta hydrolase [Nakamurella flavida]MBM9476166.1 alpha/beta hydrolase [Nakamurella flavida]MDP9777089.1 pimeloyl-ACP methyl ester carboxylesterase [Nakamurella flavida]
MSPAPPIVLLHAFPLDNRLFDGARSLLSGRRLITPDLRGCGDAGPVEPHDTPSIALLADDVVAGWDRQGLESVILGGVSLGGYVALDIVRRHPGRVAGLVLVDTRSGADDDAGRQRREDVAARADHGDRATGEDAIAPLLGDGVDGSCRRELAAIAHAVPAATVAWLQRAMACRPDADAVLRTVGVPVLVVVGEQDSVTPVAEAARMAALVRDGGGSATLVVVPGAGHLTPAEAPAVFVDALVQWVDEHWS